MNRAGENRTFHLDELGANVFWRRRTDAVKPQDDFLRPPSLATEGLQITESLGRRRFTLSRRRIQQ